ncbi:dienelactone hydrolase [Purpureocillium lavendulum]|uniref:Dienelactone hydrolase n=1 Tax=Purpureocillium lavendulum TaxID=1247861 RepID=A0AB34G0F2_9HYPO|nr:dienelactone hydrolase [Purpureocillium lavendulum]
MAPGSEGLITAPPKSGPLSVPADRDLHVNVLILNKKKKGHTLKQTHLAHNTRDLQAGAAGAAAEREVAAAKWKREKSRNWSERKISSISTGSGEPVGRMIKVGSNIDAYLAEAPPAHTARKDHGILFLPDVGGIGHNCKLMADSFAALGYTTLMPDLFDGDSVPRDRTTSTSIIDWINHGVPGKHPHTTQYVDPVVVAAIRAMRDLGLAKIAAVGYCFGAKAITNQYVVRHYKSGIDVGFIAHPSLVEEDELRAITGPLSIAAAERDEIFPTDMRHKSEGILVGTGQPYQISLYGGVEHGFAVRCNEEIPVERFARDQAFRQAAAWFDEWLSR